MSVWQYYAYINANNTTEDDMGYSALLDLIDEEYDNLNGRSEADQISFLVNEYQADADVARRALVEYGMIDVD